VPAAGNVAPAMVDDELPKLPSLSSNSITVVPSVPNSVR
jgi:hypothetical protein